MKRERAGISRRGFLSQSGAGLAAGMGLAFLPRRAWGRTVGPNERIQIAIIGCGGMGGRHLEALCENENCAILAVCDVAMSRLDNAQKKVEELTGAKPDAYQDFRPILDRQDIDAIFIATPDHWHPLLCILGCEAGKDVYVEKPVATVVEEGRCMVEVARRYGRVVQVGTQQRSMPVFQKALDVVKSGKLGQITSAGAWVGVNEWGIGETPEDIPRGLDWDLWLGPAPYMPYSPQRYFGHMGWHDYARGGQLTNWGIHLMDIVQWGIGQDRPLSVQAIGGNYRHSPGADNYETIEAIFEYKGCNVTWEQRHSNTHERGGYGVVFRGTEGVLYVDRNTYEVRPTELGIEKYIGVPEKSWADDNHHNNFFACVRSRQRPVADIEIGHRSTSAVLLAGIALKTRRKLVWDGEAERFVNDEQANRYLSRTYRPPWHLPKA